MVNVNQIVREDTGAARLRTAVDQRRDHRCARRRTPPGLLADPHQMQQVLLNLVINAEQAMVAANGRGTLILPAHLA